MGAICSGGGGQVKARIERASKSKQLALNGQADGLAPLKKLPPAVMEIDGLSTLDLDGNHFEQLPHGLTTRLPSLKILSVRQNKLRSLELVTAPPAPGAAAVAAVTTFWPSLVELHLDHNQLAALPVELFLLPKLKTLIVSHNAILKLELPNVVIPSAASEPQDPEGGAAAAAASAGEMVERKEVSLSQVSPLQTLDLASNNLDSIPDKLGHMFPKLKELKLAHNAIQSIPESLSHLSKLRRLDLSSNQLQVAGCIPASVFVDTKLDNIMLDGNPIAVGQAYYQLEGWDVYQKRAKSRLDKSIHAGVEVRAS